MWRIFTVLSSRSTFLVSFFFFRLAGMKNPFPDAAREHSLPSSGLILSGLFPFFVP